MSAAPVLDLEITDDSEMGSFDMVAAAQRCARIEVEERRQAFAPIQRLRTSEWADRHLWLSAEDNGELVKYDSALTPYHRAIMDSLGDIRVRRTVVEMASQGGKTTIMKADLGARIDLRPSPMLWAVPRDTKDVGIWSKERVDPMIRDTPVLRGRVSDATRDKRNTIARKAFAGGYLGIVGMTQPADLSARPVPVVRVDEIDRAPRESGKEGAGLGLLRRRMTKFMYRSLGLFGTPTITGDSPIDAEMQTTNIQKWYVPCPHCKHFQVLMWGGKEIAWGIKWNKENLRQAWYVCEQCLGIIDEKQKRWMNDRAEWRVTQPQFDDHGYWMNALCYPFDGSKWGTLVHDEWTKTRGNPLELKQFVNTVLAETYEDRTARLEVGDLAKRFEKYEAPVPHGVAVLTRAVDVQDDRLEMAVWGFGADRESWPIDYVYIPGDPGTPVPWRKLDELRATKLYRHASGRMMRPIVTFIDALGHQTSHVHAWAKRHRADLEPAFAISGDGREGHPILSEPTHHKKARLTTYRIGTWDAKFDILTRLHGVDPADEPGQRVAGYIHLPDVDWFDAERLRQLAHSEKLVEAPVRGRMARFWEVKGRNEFLDLAVYCLAGLYTLGLKRVYNDLGAIADAVSVPLPKDPAETTAPAPAGRRMLSKGIRVV